MLPRMVKVSVCAGAVRAYFGEPKSQRCRAERCRCGNAQIQAPLTLTGRVLFVGSSITAVVHLQLSPHATTARRIERHGVRSTCRYPPPLRTAASPGEAITLRLKLCVVVPLPSWQSCLSPHATTVPSDLSATV